ncbi:uncharacterized protein LOC133195144 [Saccostrea echinata]|uniref:uncharacterized protein LOC133195144 n=1 Tax=Saccostrea echinata TaxID=191078 RepID=UPI002A7FDBBE|nr:uncharacterized protein LOC133195144 [Saccostrea echinata]
MKTRDKRIVLVWFSFIICNVDITVSTKDSWNWFEAQQHCSHTNDTLKTNDVTLNSFQHWTGFYRRYSPWIKLLGCYDSKVVNEHRTYNFYFNFTSAGFCREICASVNLTHFGIQLKECVCFEGPVFAETIPSNQCNSLCYDVGDEGGIKFLECGGPNAYTLYTSEDDNVKRRTACLAVNCGAVKKFSNSSNCSESYFGACVYKGYLGCFQDQPKRTLSGNFTHSFYLTVEFCRTYCTDYQFYGVEYGGECFCGNFFTSFIRKPEGECNMTCHWDNSQICGGGNRINIYSNLNYETEIKTNWISSMQICKTRSPPSYLIGNVSLTDATMACKQLHGTQRGLSWLSIAKEMYTGYDRGVAVDIDERETFYQCQKCNQTGCEYIDCFKKLNYLICEKESGIEIPQNRMTYSNINFRTIIPLSLVAVILFGCLVMGMVCYKRRRSNQENKKTAPNLANLNENFYANEAHALDMYHAKIQENFYDNYQESFDRVYDHLRDIETRTHKPENFYDHATVVAEQEYAYGGYKLRFEGKQQQLEESTYDHTASISDSR